MKTRILGAVVATAFAGLATAGSFTIDLSNYAVDGGWSDNFPSFTFDIGGPGMVTTMDVSFSFVTSSPSWQSEGSISIDTDSGWYDVFFDELGAPDSVGTFSYSGSFSVDLATDDGFIYLTLWDSWQDDVVFPDAYFGAGSSITLHYVPAPGAMAMLGLGGLVAGRRRR